MKGRDVKTKTLTAMVAASMVVGLCPATAFAAGSDALADKIYTGTAHVVNNPDDENEWEEYDVSVDLTVTDGKFSDITVTPDSHYDEEESGSYFNKAVSKSKGFKTLLEGKDATEDTINGWDTVGGATRTSEAVKEAALKAVQSAPSEGENQPEEEYKYVYAGLTWAEYWAAEGVQAAGSTESSSEPDRKGELDKGAFDTVSRATTNHGLHRGSYQCMAAITLNDGTTLDVAYYTGTTEGVLTNGETFSYDKSDIASYVVTGLKYVPVKVAAADYAAFCEKYSVIENGGKLAGGFSENNLTAYTDVTADVTEETNGLKTASKNEDGTFSFSERAAGTASGIKDTNLKTADGIESTIKEANGSYGEFLRVDLTGNYGDLAANMQAVKWTYYGDDSTYTNALATYGTKFASDNWMHKSMGIQLGLTDSKRCTLPEGTDGTGYWSITVYALGYEDYTITFQATDENIVKADPVTSTADLEEAIKRAEALTESDYTPESWANMQTELAEAREELQAQHSQSAVDEAANHLNSAIEALVSAAEKVSYVLMNIPYAQFYQADVRNDVQVDAFTSATLNKTRTPSLAGKSYHVNSDGSDITGITFPVKVDSGIDLSGYTQVTDDDSVTITVTNRGNTTTTTYSGKDALFESASYSYYVLEEMPAFYKEATVNEDGSLSFGETIGEVQNVSDGSAELSTDSNYGDYQLEVDGLPESITSEKIYGVVISTAENDYGLRHLENIWRVSELAWCTGFTESVHNCPTSSAHYESMMGQTLNKITYYTSEGIYEIPVNVYVPVKLANTVSVEDASVMAENTTISVETLPEDFAAQYSVEGLEMSVENGVMTYSNAKPGRYTLIVSDQNNKYAELKVEFVLSAESLPAGYNGENKSPALIKSADATDEEFAGYLKNIESVSVNDKIYPAKGRGSVVIVNENGTINTDAEVQGGPDSPKTLLFAEGNTYEVTVSATGYPDLSFTYTKEGEVVVEVNTSSLEKAIAAAEALKEADYTADSWNVLQTALADAKNVLDAKESQNTVDKAVDTLNSAISALVKKAASEKPGTADKPDTSDKTNTGSGNKTTSSSDSAKNAVKTGDPANVMGLLGLAVSSLGVGGFTLNRRRKYRKDK